MADMQQQNRRIVLAAYPQGMATERDFRLVTEPVPVAGPGEFLVKNRWISVDPMLRIRIDARPLGGTLAPLPLGSVIPGAAVGEIVASSHADFAPGALVEGRFGWQDLAISNGVGVHRVDSSLASPDVALGPLGLPGFSAYVGLHVAGGVTPGQTVLVSGAAGAVGSIVGPLARTAGARVIGIASGADKCAYLTDVLHYDGAIDRSVGSVGAQLGKLGPEGIDLYFDNVGGDMLLDVMPHLKRRGQVILCGLMAHYNGLKTDGPDRFAGFLEAIMNSTATIRAFANVDYEHLRPDFMRDVAPLIASGALPYRVHARDGLEAAPQALAGLFAEGVTGKLVVRV